MTKTRSALPAERPLRLFVNDTELVTLMATPDQLEELAYGWLWSNNLISAADDVLELLADADRALIWIKTRRELPPTLTRTVASGCGGGELVVKLTDSLPRVDSGLKVSLTELYDRQAEFLKQAVLYQRTGGVHGAALADADRVIHVAEDIGRHNAVDKIIGWSLKRSLDLSDKLILTTGRISSEMLTKAARAGLGLVGSMTAATDLAVKLAETAGVTVVGYIRKEKAVVYSRPERLSH